MGRKNKAAQGLQHQPASGDGAAAAGGRKGKQEDSQLWSALKHEDEEELRELLFDELGDPETGEISLTLKATARKLVNQPNAKKLYPLSFAVSEGLGPTVVQFLLRAGAQVNKRDDTAKMLTALHAACWNEDEEAVLTLLRAGADPRVCDADGRTPLHVLATSNAVALVSLLLNQVARTEIGDGAGVEAGATAAAIDVDAPFTTASSKVLALDPVALLGVRDKQDGTTALHLALGEPTYGFGVAQALLAYLEGYRSTSPSAAAAVAELTSSAATATGDTSLHALVCAPNTEDAVVDAMVRRLIDLGADVLVRNRSGQSAAELAIATRAGRSGGSSSSTKAAVQLYDTLLTAMAARDAAAVAEPNRDGLALLHVAIAARNVAAVKALCSVCAGSAAGKGGAVLTRPLVTPTGEQLTVAELLVRSEGSAEMVQALTTANVVTRDEYEVVKRQREASATEGVDGATGDGADGEAEEDADEGGEEEEEDGTGGADTAANASSAAGLKRGPGGAGAGGGGVSRLQRARKARAATAAQRKAHGSGGRHGLLDGVDGAEHARGLFNGGVSTPVLIIGVLLLVSLFVSGYTMAVEPAAGQAL